jgi:hypothetical protein
MNYQDWLIAVDKLLKEGGAGYSTAQIEKDDLRAAFLQGVTPVDYVEQGDHPLQVAKSELPFPPISLDQAKFLVRTLDQAGLALIILGVLSLGFGIYGMFGTIGGIIEMATQSRGSRFETSNAQVAMYSLSTLVSVVTIAAMSATLGIIAWAVSGMLRATCKVPRAKP